MGENGAIIKSRGGGGGGRRQKRGHTMVFQKWQGMRRVWILQVGRSETRAITNLSIRFSGERGLLEHLSTK